MQADKLPNEDARVAALHSYYILDSAVEKEFEDVTRVVSRICGVPITVINLIDRDRQWFVSEIGLGVRETPLDISICAHAILQQDLFIVPDTQEDERFANNPLVTGNPHLRFYAGALLKTSEGHPLGTLCVLDYVKRDLTEDQKDVLQVFANQVMRQLDLRKRIKEQEQATALLDAAYAHEKQIAETLQRSLLVDAESLKFSGVEVTPLYEAAWNEAEVGGDFYDAFTLDSATVVLVVGDVAGKGLEAAARTAEVKYALRAFLQEYPHPARTLARLNDFLCQFHAFGKEETPRFVVATIGILNTQTGQATFSFAGSEPTILLRNDGSAETMSVGGMPLGIDSGVEFEELSWLMQSGESVLLATDGLTEARRDKALLGIEGLVKMALDAQGMSPLSAFVEKIMQDVKNYAGGTLHDDACLLLARRL